MLLSSYLLDEDNNNRIREAAAALGHDFIPAPVNSKGRMATPIVRDPNIDLP